MQVIRPAHHNGDNAPVSGNSDSSSSSSNGRGTDSRTAAPTTATSTGTGTRATTTRRGSFSKKFSPKYLPIEQGGHILPGEDSNSHPHRPSSQTQSINRSASVDDSLAVPTPGTSLSRGATVNHTHTLALASGSGSCSDLRALSPFHTSEGK